MGGGVRVSLEPAFLKSKGLEKGRIIGKECRCRPGEYIILYSYYSISPQKKTTLRVKAPDISSSTACDEDFVVVALMDNILKGIHTVTDAMPCFRSS